MSLSANASTVPGPWDVVSMATDTIPVKDNKGDFINDPNKNPFDIVPNNVTQTVEYDTKTGKYILTEKIGDEYYRMPTYMTFEEYLEWRKKQDQKEHFAKLGGISTGKKGGLTLDDPMAGIDVSGSLVDRLFGGTEVNIQPQGQVDVTVQSRYSKTTGNQAFNPVQFNPIDPSVAIRVSVDGNIGSKLNLGFNYDTQSQFDFDRKIKLEYDTEAFGEDDIIKTIEAGNVSLPLRSNLIQGPQSLFGLKTQLQFGKLYLTAIASQQQSEQKSIRIENGAAIQEFELTVDRYDENRHFFISHFNRDNFEPALRRLPQINSAFRIADIEVWISNDRILQNNVQNTTSIAAISDLAEHDVAQFDNQNPSFIAQYGPNPANPKTEVMIKDLDGNTTIDVLPDNTNNGIWDRLILDNENINSRSEASAIMSAAGMKQGKDFEVFEGRRLSQNEFSYNEQLGFISLNVRLRPNQVLAVSYNYYYTGLCEDPEKPLQVGQLSTNSAQYSSVGPVNGVVERDSIEPNKVVFAKLLKSSTQPTNIPSYDLMMKNVYSLGASVQDNPEEFSFDIFYEDDRDGTFKKFLPEPALKFSPLLNLFNLDRLNKTNDPQPDGVFDFVAGVTIIPRSGSVVFPVLEPFGRDLQFLVKNELINVRGTSVEEADRVAAIVDERYAFNALYDTSVTIAKQGLEFNKFRMMGFVKSSTSGSISLGPFVPQGSVRVRAGGVELIEGSDYEIDYSLGRLRIINPSYLQQGTPIDVSFEDQSLFSLQQKNMLGLRADYNITKKASIGATMMRLTERPFTQKVNIGNDPIRNTIYGMDFAYSSDAPFVTKAVDKLPFYSTNQPSAVNFYAEGAYLRPGYSKAIGVLNEEGKREPVVSIDDFEGSIANFQLGGFNTQAWRLASTPTDASFPEGKLINDLTYGANRAKLSWFSVDRIARGGGNAERDPYTGQLSQQDLFPDRQTQVGQSELNTFNISFYPNERGPYNYDLPDGRGGLTAGIDIPASQAAGDVRLANPESRWGGIMRSFSSTDFEAANYEFIEFWMLNPYTERPDGLQHAEDEQGKIVIQLGNISEDILKDGSQLYENALPKNPSDDLKVRKTIWGRATENIPFVNGFDRSEETDQDLGFDGLTDSLERLQYADYLSQLNNAGLNFPDLLADPAADNFNDIQEGEDKSLLEQYKDISNPQGNSPIANNQTSRVFRGNRLPDTEDMNNNRTLDNSENYYTYEIPIEYEADPRTPGGKLNTFAARKFITDSIVISRSASSETWYRFRVPINQFDRAKDITGFRSIQFMRMYMTGFKSAKTFRLAEFQLSRNQWRKSSQCFSDAVVNNAFSVDEVGVQENGSRMPFNYKTPDGVKIEIQQTSLAALQQDEKSMALKFNDLADNCEIGVNKLAELDLTQYKRIQLFAHGELADKSLDLGKDGDMKLYMKLGKDLSRHYYEYEIPLKFSDRGRASDKKNIWPEENFMSLPLKYFTEAKKLRIGSNAAVLDTFVVKENELNAESASDRLIKVVGTPSLARIKIVEIGVRNANGEDVFLSGEVWFNELRLLGLNQSGALAGEARLQIQMADLGEINLSGSYSDIGWGALDQRLDERNRRELIQYDLATSLQLDKFFPDKWGLSIPFYAQYTSNTSNLQYEPYEGDLTVDEKIGAVEQQKLAIPAKADSLDREIVDIRERSKEKTTIKSYNFTNVKKKSSGKSYPWSPSNVSVSYAYTETTISNPIIAEDKTKEHNTSIDYAYSGKANYITPFKKVKNKNLKLISELNFNPLPNSFTFGTDLNRKLNTRRFRLPADPVFQFDDKRFFWNRDYGLVWDFTKSLKFNFKARAEAIVDELRQSGIEATPANRPYYNEFGERVFFGTEDNDIIQDSVNLYRNNNLRKLGRSKNYNHNFSLTYNLPIRYLPYMDWVTSKADYKVNYGWNAGARLFIDSDQNLLGNTIQNKQTLSFNATLSFDKLYNKSKYLKAIDRGKKTTRRSSRKKSTPKKDAKDTASNDKKSRTKSSDGPSKAERLLIRPLLMLRNVKFTYAEDRGTVIPGFMPESKLLGLSSGFDAPGWGFVSGLQPNLKTWLPSSQTDARGDWFNPSTNYNGIISQKQNQTVNLKIALEPIKDLDIDIDFKKKYTLSHQEQLKVIKDGQGFTNGFDFDMGSYNYTHFGLSTLFKNSDELYNQFRSERVVISQKLAERAGITDPHDNPDFANVYYKGYGPENPDVSIPAFLAIYQGRNVDDLLANSLTSKVSKRSFIPAPNWSLKYDGLSKLEIFRDVISSFSLRHQYIGTTAVNSFSTNILFDVGNPFDLSQSTNDNYLSEFNIPTIRIADQFSPLIGFSLKLKNEMTFEGGFNKSRILNLTQLNTSESYNDEITFGFGYTIKNFRSNSNKKRRSRRDQNDDKNNGTLSGRNIRSKVNRTRGRTLTMNLDFSFIDNGEVIYRHGQETDPETTRGTRSMVINPSVDYDVNKNLTMRFFVNYNNTISKNTISVDRLDIRAGATAQLKIN